MADERGLFVHQDGTVGTTALQARMALAGLVAATGSFGPRAGVISGCVVSGTTATSPWTYSVGTGHLATSKSAGDGAVLRAISSATTVETSAAPGSGSRIDIIYAAHNDILSDADSDPVLGVAQGVASGSPVAPSIPAGAIEVGRATVPSGATNTQGATFSTTNVQYTAARGAAIPVTGQTQRDALSGLASLTNPITVHRRDTGRIERNAGSGWFTIGGSAPTAYTPALTGSSSNPTLGSGGDAKGRWGRSGDFVHGWFLLKFGTSGIGVGSGTYQISAPVTIANADTDASLGTVWMYDSSASTGYMGELYPYSSTLMAIRPAGGGGAAVTSAVPFAWSTGDSIRGDFHLEV